MEDNVLRVKRVHSGRLVDISESNNHKISLQFIPRPILHLLILSQECLWNLCVRAVADVTNLFPGVWRLFWAVVGTIQRTDLPGSSLNIKSAGICVVDQLSNPGPQSQSFHIHGIIAHFLHKGEMGLIQSHLHLVSRIQGNLLLKSDSIAQGSATFIGRIEISYCPKQRFLKCLMLAFEFQCLIARVLGAEIC